MKGKSFELRGRVDKYFQIPKSGLLELDYVSIKRPPRNSHVYSEDEFRQWLATLNLVPNSNVQHFADYVSKKNEVVESTKPENPQKEELQVEKETKSEQVEENPQIQEPEKKNRFKITSQRRKSILACVSPQRFYNHLFYFSDL